MAAPDRLVGDDGHYGDDHAEKPDGARSLDLFSTPGKAGLRNGPHGSPSRAKYPTVSNAARRDGSGNEEEEAADGGRTRDLKLGKLALYQLSYRRIGR
jgi:hypothetical protein